MKGNKYTFKQSNIFAQLKPGSIVKIHHMNTSKYHGNYIMRVDDRDIQVYSKGKVLAITVYSKSGYDIGRAWHDDIIDNIEWEIIKET